VRQSSSIRERILIINGILTGDVTLAISRPGTQVKGFLVADITPKI
jgi:hypothetical protein